MNAEYDISTSEFLEWTRREIDILRTECLLNGECQGIRQAWKKINEIRGGPRSVVGVCDRAKKLGLISEDQGPICEVELEILATHRYQWMKAHNTLLHRGFCRETRLVKTICKARAKGKTWNKCTLDQLNDIHELYIEQTGNGASKSEARRTVAHKMGVPESRVARALKRSETNVENTSFLKLPLPWNEEKDRSLASLVAAHNANFEIIRMELPGHSLHSCERRWNKLKWASIKKEEEVVL